MENLTDLGVVKALLARHHFTFSKAMGQNFLVNPSVCPRMAQASGAGPGVGVLEIGPGIGVLTRELAKRADRVVSLELDGRLLPILQETLAGFDNVRILQQDVLKADLGALLARELAGLQVVVCANLPYYITTPVLMALLEGGLPIQAVTVMVQKEAARRLCAPMGSRQCGAVSGAVWYYSRPEILFEVSRGSFLPPPDVDSAVIRLQMRSRPAVEVQRPALLFAVIRGSFGQRRKTIANSLGGALGLPKAQVIAALEQAGLPAAARPEQLTLEQFAALAQALSPLVPGGEL